VLVLEVSGIETHQPEMTVRTAYDLKPSMMTSITLILSLLALGHCV
jgi:hypothetical protein